MSQLIGATAVQIAADVRAGSISAVAVLEAHRARVAQREHVVGAFQERRDAAARRDAEAVDADVAEGRASGLPLAGVPIAVKDVVAVAGLPTRHGSAATSAEPNGDDDLLVSRLRAAGAIVLGTTRCPELSIFGSTDGVFGATHNPWDPTRSVGGSSGGSAAAVAAAMVPVALASDGMGSVRIPAAACGLVGIKPGSGVVPMRFGDADEHWFGMTQYGPLATTVADAALLLDVLADSDVHRDPRPPSRPLRIGVSWQVPPPGLPAPRAQRRLVTDLAAKMSAAGHVVVRADPPYSLGATIDTGVRWMVGSREDAALLAVDPDELLPRTVGHIRAGRLLERVRPIRPEATARFRAAVDEFFAGIDVLLTPAMTGPPPEGHDWFRRSWLANIRSNALWAPFQNPWNYADVPAASVPMALGPDRMPQAVQVVAPRGDERGLLSALALIEELSPWRRHPT